MKIIREAISNYIRAVTNGYFIRPRDGFPEDLSAFNGEIDEMAAGARHYGHYEILQPAIEYLLAHPEIDLEHLGSSENWVWENDEVRALLLHMREYLWPDAGPVPSGGPPGVELVPAGGRGWGPLMPAVLSEK